MATGKSFGARHVNFSLRQIRYFLATAQLGQVSRAAEQLHVTQSAVTLSIRDLERELDYPLFRRESHGMELTDDGRQFLSHALEIEAAIEKVHNIARTNEFTGEITLAASSTVVGYFLAEHIHRLSELHPRLQISILELDRQQIMTGLLAGDFPLALLVTSNVRDPGIRTQTLFDSRRRLWVAAGHRLLHQNEVHLVDIVDEPLMLLTVDEAADAAARYWGQYGLEPNIRLRSTSIEAVRSMVAHGQGIAIASDMQYRPWSLEGKRVETVLLEEAIQPLSIGMAWCADRPAHAATQMVQDYFRKRYLDPPIRHKGMRR